MLARPPTFSMQRCLIFILNVVSAQQMGGGCLCRLARRFLFVQCYGQWINVAKRCKSGIVKKLLKIDW